MRSSLVVDLDREQSLAAMSHPLHASTFAGRSHVEIDAGVVHALLNARFYSSDRGQFTSEDPSHLAIGNPTQVKQLTGQDMKTYLSDPQMLNSYSYARGNPITNKDPLGNFSVGVSINGNAEGGFAAYSATYVSRNYNLVVDPSSLQAYVVKSTSGATNAGYMNNYQSAPDNGKTPFVVGLYGGVGVSGNFSPYLTNPNDIRGTQNSVNVNLPFVSFSAQGEETGNPTYSVAPGAKGLASVSQYPVYTQINRIYSVNQYVSNAASRVSSYYQAAIASIQAKISAIQSKINELKANSSKN